MEIALGTVQFGIAYGIAGREQPVPESEVRDILEMAAKRGVRTLDTAAAYGDIESRLLRLIADLPLQVVSKIPAVPGDLAAQNAAVWAKEQIARSEDHLGERLTGLMCHRDADLQNERGQAVWASLADWGQRTGRAVGASFYEPEHCIRASHERGITLAQVPGNAFDQRVALLPPASAGSCEIHLRSAFLQGLLLMNPAAAARRLPAAAPVLGRWSALCLASGCSPLVLALSVVRGFTAVSKVVVGVDNLRQLIEILDAWDVATPISAPELSCHEAGVIDPRCWHV